MRSSLCRAHFFLFVSLLAQVGTRHEQAQYSFPRKDFVVQIRGMDW